MRHSVRRNCHRAKLFFVGAPNEIGHKCAASPSEANPARNPQDALHRDVVHRDADISVRYRSHGLMSALIARLVALSCRHAWAVIALALLLAIAAGYYAAGHIAIDTDNAKLFSPNLDWRKREVAYDAAF